MAILKSVGGRVQGAFILYWGIHTNTHVLTSDRRLHVMATAQDEWAVEENMQPWIVGQDRVKADYGVWVEGKLYQKLE